MAYISILLLLLFSLHKQTNKQTKYVVTTLVTQKKCRNDKQGKNTIQDQISEENETASDSSRRK